MLFVSFALICLAQSLFAVELVIYKSFTEVRQPHSGVGDYPYQFENTEFQNIIDGTISWDGTPISRQEVYSTTQTLKDARVTVRFTSTCGCEKIDAKIVDPDTMLLQNLNTGAYFYADKQSLEYVSVQPSRPSTTLMLQFQNSAAQHTGTLSYLMRGISWTPNYDLFVTNSENFELRSYANIKNDQQREYTVEKTSLLGGDVQLAGSSFPSGDREMAFNLKPSMHNRPILMGGEQQGLYTYLLNDKYTLRPSSSIRLPFVDIDAKYKFYYKTSTGIGNGLYQGVFDRTYDLTPNHFMPAGVITVRDNHVLVGQAALPDIPENYTQTFTVGRDNDVRYSVRGVLKTKTDSNATIQTETYEVTVQIINFKNKNVDTKLLLQGGLQFLSYDTTCRSATVNGNEITLPIQLQKGETQQCKFNLTIRLS